MSGNVGQPRFKRPPAISNALAGGGMVASVACFFALPVCTSHGKQLTLAELLSQQSSGDGWASLLSAAVCILVFLATFMPLLLWIELGLARKPLSRKVRWRLVGQGIVGLLGVALTLTSMLFAELVIAMDQPHLPQLAGAYIVPITQGIFALASVLLAILPAKGPSAS